MPMKSKREIVNTPTMVGDFLKEEKRAKECWLKRQTGDARNREWRAKLNCVRRRGRTISGCQGIEPAIAG